jgi:phenylalanyl-tRNA synthetase alpha chain
MDLHPKAARLLQALTDHDGKARVEDLEEELSHGAVIRPAKWLEDAMLVEIDEESTVHYRITSKGEDAYINGLPEKRLLSEIEDGPERMDELQDLIGPFNIALGECKQNDWADIIQEGGYKKVQITEQGQAKLEDGFPEEEILEDVTDTDEWNGEDTDDDMIGELLDRGLVERVEQSWRTLAITEKGRKEYEKYEERQEQEKEKEKEKVGTLTPEIIRSGEWKKRGVREYNVEAETDPERPGKRQPYRSYLDDVRQEFMSMGFKEAKTDLVEMEFWNFDVLFQAQDHPAREVHDKFELEDPAHGDLMHDEIVERVKKVHEEGWTLDSKGWEYEWSKRQASKLMLRSQTTAATIRYLAEGVESPAKLFSIDRVFRYDEIDSTHFIEFNQAEGIVKAEDLSLKDLLGYLKMFGEEIAGAEKIRFRPGYFPFTEPSVELDAYHPELGWVELGGAGLFRPEVRHPLDVDDPVIAWGMGIDRIAMFKLGKDDIRELLFPQDIQELRESSIVDVR